MCHAFQLKVQDLKGATTHLGPRLGIIKAWLAVFGRATVLLSIIE